MTIERVKELLAKATPGPWFVGGHDFQGNVHLLQEQVDSGLSYLTSWGILNSHGYPVEDNARLVAALPDIARLAIELSEEVERLKKG
jgi:hypothetical protein